MRIFVTGGAGFIGSYIVRDLIKNNHTVTVFDNLSTGSKANVPRGVSLVVGDVRDKKLLKVILEGHDAVIHLAAQAIVPVSVRDPDTTYSINLEGGRNLLECMSNVGVDKLVYSSTTAVYGNPKKQPIAEDDPKVPVNPYGDSKLKLEKLCFEYHKKYGLSVTTFRYFNPFGPFESHDPETHAVPNFINAALQNKPIPLYWNGDQIRDFFYVEDLASMHVEALSFDGFSTYNLGSGEGISVRELAKKITNIAGSLSAFHNLGERDGDPPKLVADISKAKSELQWSPTPIDEALMKTIEYFTGHQNKLLDGRSTSSKIKAHPSKVTVG